MNNCPNCGKETAMQQAVCACGELLRAEVTHHANLWETETVFRPTQKAKIKYAAPIAIVFLVTAAVLILAWPQFTENRRTSDVAITSNAEHIPAQSDLIQSADLIQTDNLNGPDTQEGVFDFSKSGTASHNVKTKNALKPTIEGGLRPQAETLLGNSLDERLLSDKDSSQANAEGKPLSDCKPETTVPLKPVDQASPSLSEPKPQLK